MIFEIKKLGEICKFQGGSQPPKSNFIYEPKNGYIRFLQIRDFGSEKNHTYIPENKKNKICNSDDIMIGRYGASVGKILRGRSGAYNVALMKATPLNSLVNKEFLWNYFNSSLFQNDLRKVPSRSAQAGFSKDDIFNFQVPLPPLLIQQSIVDKLNSIFAEIDKATAAAEANTKNAEELFQSYLSKIIKKESENDKIVKLGTICEIARGGSPRPINKFITNDEDGVNWIKISDATRSKKYIFKTREKIIKSGVSRSRLVREGDLLLSNSMSYGRPYIMSTTGCIHDGWLVLSKYQKFLDIDFFYFLLSSAIIVKQFDNLAKGSTVSNLNIDLVSRVEFKLPSLSKQKLIVSKLNLLSNNVDIIKNSNSNKFNELLKLKQSIFKQTFNDKLVKAA